nr:putative SWI/SNF-related matrix-associated actin-dependent regulator of chromatin subfamily A member 3-like 3 isoform X1 [Ipomoea trifida]
MGLGKTVTSIALILARLGKGIPDNQELAEDMAITQHSRNRRIKGGTLLIVCPMALLGQWKDELEAHSKPDSISVCVHYGGDISNDPRVIAEPDVVLTTYGLLTAAYKANNVQDLYSLMCFLHVEPWCNWAWSNELIQRPYDLWEWDQRTLKLIKAILRQLMLRRTKEIKDKEGRLIAISFMCLYLCQFQGSLPDFNERNLEFLTPETDLEVLRALEAFEVKIINHEHVTRRRVVKQKRLPKCQIEKLLDVFPQFMFASGNGRRARELPGAALFLLSFTLKGLNMPGA